MSTRRVEFTEAVKIGHETYLEGDRKAFPKAEADQYISLGWAKDPETGEQGERKPGAHRIQPDPVVQDSQ